MRQVGQLPRIPTNVSDCYHGSQPQKKTYKDTYVEIFMEAIPLFLLLNKLKQTKMPENGRSTG